MSKAAYRFRDGSHLNGDAQSVGERLEVLRKEAGGVTPAQVVADARRPTSALHPFFEWDDAKAAERHRIEQAGHLIRCVTVVVDEPDDPQTSLPGAPGSSPGTLRMRAFVPVQKANGAKVFESTAVAMSDAEYRRQILARAHGELVAIRSKYSEIEELAAVFTAVDGIGRLLSAERQDH